MSFTVTDLGTKNTNASGNSFIALLQDVPAGALVCVLAAAYGATFTDVSDDGGNTYVQTNADEAINGNLSNGIAGFWLAEITSPMSAGQIIDLNTDGPNGSAQAATAFMVTGADPAKYNLGAVNFANGNFNGSIGQPSVSVTPNFANSLMVGWVALFNGGSAIPTYTQASGYSTPPTSVVSSVIPNAEKIAGGNKIQPTIASVTFNPTISGTNAAWTVFLFEIPAAANVALYNPWPQLGPILAQ